MSYAIDKTKTQPKAKSQKPKANAKSQKPKANQRFWLQYATNSMQIRDLGSKMQQIARKTAPGPRLKNNKKTKKYITKNIYPPYSFHMCSPSHGQESPQSKGNNVERFEPRFVLERPKRATSFA